MIARGFLLEVQAQALIGRGVTAPSHRSCDLFLEATAGVTIALVSSLERKRRQPGFTTDDPAFVGWHQLVGGIQGSQVHFDFVGGACENGRAAAGQKNRPAYSRVSPSIVTAS